MAPTAPKQSQLRTKKSDIGTKTMSEKTKFKNRYSTLKKKAMELSTLCDANACVFFRNPENGTVETMVYPPSSNMAHIVSKYMKTDQKSRCRKENKMLDGKKDMRSGDDKFLDGLTMDSVSSLLNALESKYQSLCDIVSFRNVSQLIESLNNGELDKGEAKTANFLQIEGASSDDHNHQMWVQTDGDDDEFSSICEMIDFSDSSTMPSIDSIFLKDYECVDHQYNSFVETDQFGQYNFDNFYDSNSLVWPQEYVAES